MEAENVDDVTTPSVTVVVRTVKASKPTFLSKRVEAGQEKMDLPDFYTHDAASKSMLVAPQEPFTTDSNGLIGKQSSPLIQVGQEPNAKRRKILLKKAAKTSIVGGQEVVNELHAKIEELKKETAMYSGKLRHLSEKCYHLKEDNDLLWDELKLYCTPEMLLDLEKSNPDRSLQQVETEDISEA